MTWGVAGRKDAEHLDARIPAQRCRLEENLAVYPLGPHPQMVPRGQKVRNEATTLGATQHKEQRLGGSTVWQN